MRRMYPIIMGISKKDLFKIKKHLKRRRYGDFAFVKMGEKFNVYLMKKKKLKRVV